jgi:uncharacterized membrane protein YqjE
MAIVQALLALVSRSLGRISSAIFGWAVIALFGQTSGTEQAVLSALVGAAAAWPILVLGVVFPKIAVFLLAFVPLPEWIPKWIIRAVWITLALAVPFAIGLTLSLRQRRQPPGTAGGGVGPERESRLARLVRGFPITVGIAAAFVVVFITVPALRVISFFRRRIDLQIPLVTDAASYNEVALTVARTLTGHGFVLWRATPGWWMTGPSRILLRLGGPAFRDHIPEHLAYFRGPRLEAALYTNALLLRGNEQDTAWAHGIVVEALTDAPALQTFNPAAQDIERQIRRVWAVYRENPDAHVGAAALLGRLGEIVRDIATLPVAYDEWQIIYRQALQLGRALDGERQLLEPFAKTSEPAGASRPAAKEASMATDLDREWARTLSNRALIGEIFAKATLLVKKEVELAKTELREDFAAELGVLKAVAVAAIIALLGLNAFVVAGVFALTAVLPGWAAALIVGGTFLAVAVVLGFVGWRRHVTKPLDATRQSLEKDIQWIKERAA